MTEPRLCQNVSRPRRIRLDFLPQLIHKYSQVFYFVTIVRAPHCLENLVMRQDFLRMYDEIVQQIELRRCKTRHTPVRPDLTVAKADLQAFQPKYSPCGGRNPPQRRPNTSQQFVDIERLGHITVGSSI